MFALVQVTLCICAVLVSSRNLYIYALGDSRLARAAIHNHYAVARRSMPRRQRKFHATTIHTGRAVQIATRSALIVAAARDASSPHDNRALRSAKSRIVLLVSMQAP